MFETTNQVWLRFFPTITNHHYLRALFLNNRFSPTGHRSWRKMFSYSDGRISGAGMAPTRNAGKRERQRPGVPRSLGIEQL